MVRIGISSRESTKLPLLYGLVDVVLRALGEFNGQIIVSDITNEQPQGVISLGACGVARGHSPDSTEFHSLNLIPAGSTSSTGTVKFADSKLLPAVYRNREIPGLRCPSRTLPIRGEVLARSTDGPIWTCEHENQKRTDSFLVLDDWYNEGDALFQHLGGSRLMDLLPMVHWMRTLLGLTDLKSAPLRACIQFDDPNLHGPTYGFMDFRDLANHASKHNYHAAMATVPLDNYLVNNRAAALFRGNPKRLSLLIHGNNHTNRELAQDYSDEKRRQLVQQSLTRIERLEKHSGVSVCRVMAAPHGACSEAMLESLARYGYEAASISSGSLAAHNHGRPWTRYLGLAPVEMIRGLPVMNRFRLKQGCENSVLLAAYLGQPIIPVGHHWDLAGGLDLLQGLAGFINSLGSVSWMPMSGLSRMNYRAHISNDCLEIELFSRLVEICVPPGTETLKIKAPWVDLGIESIIAEAGGQAVKIAKATPYTFGVSRLDRVTVQVVRRAERTHDQVSLQRTPLGALGRRVLSEARDRVMPWLPARLVKRG